MLDRSSGGGLGIQIVHFDGEEDLPGSRVNEVRPGSCADEAGFQKGDVILEVNGENVHNKGSMEEVIEVIQNSGEKIEFLLTTIASLENPKFPESEEEKKPEKAKEYNAAVPFTTRFMRDGEVEGVHYNFVTREVFEKLIKDNKMIEYGTHKGNYYGTMKSEGGGGDQEDERVQRNQSMTTAITSESSSGQSEATVSDLMMALRLKSPKKELAECPPEYKDMVLSQFLSLKHEQLELKQLRNNVKDGVYLFTTAYTSRAKRDNEVHGREYVFLTKEEFTQAIQEDRMLEYGTRGENMYGTPKLLKADLVAAMSNDNKKMRSTTSEATLGAILEKTGIQVHVGAEKTASEFLNEVAPGHEQLGEIRDKIKAAIYDLTVPLTTRAPRPGEKNGVHYNFVTKEEFESYIQADALLEYGEKNGIYYGTLKPTEEDVKAAQPRSSTLSPLGDNDDGYLEVGDTDEGWTEAAV